MTTTTEARVETAAGRIYIERRSPTEVDIAVYTGGTTVRLDLSYAEARELARALSEVVG